MPCQLSRRAYGSALALGWTRLNREQRTAQLPEAGAGWRVFRAAVVFVDQAGIRHLAGDLAKFAARGSDQIAENILLRPRPRSDTYANLIELLERLATAPHREAACPVGSVSVT